MGYQVENYSDEQKLAHQKRASIVMTNLHADPVWEARNVARFVGKHSEEYYQGEYKSEKSGLIRYKSSLELSAFVKLDRDLLVESFIYEPGRIAYELSGKTRHYHPDILVFFSNGSKTLVEVKDINEISLPQNQAKFKSARKFCRARGYSFEVWSNRELFPYVHSIRSVLRSWSN